MSSTQRKQIEVDGNNIDELDAILQNSCKFASFDLHIDLREVSISELTTLWPFALHIISTYASYMDKANHSLHVIGPRQSIISSEKMRNYLTDRVNCSVSCELA